MQLKLFIMPLIGALLLVIGFMRHSSLESMMIRGMGQTDGMGISLFIMSGILLVGGLIYGLAASDPNALAETKCPKCGGTNAGQDKNCRYCNHALEVESKEVPIQPQNSGSADGIVLQLQNLLILKDSGAISPEEYIAAKAKILN